MNSSMSAVQESQDRWNEIYKEYLSSLKTGDTVYPAYDAKSCRATACKITATSDKYFRVEGVFWDDIDISTMSIFDRATGWGNDFYLLLHPECFERDPRHGRKYLEGLGILKN
jgi:hypothetical protein